MAESMTPVALLLIAMLGFGEFLLFGALAEAYRDIRQIRELTGAVDEPVPIGLGPAQDAQPSQMGLHPDLDHAARAMVIFLESRCGTCRLILTSLNGGIPLGVWLVAIGDSPEAAGQWLRESGFDVTALGRSNLTAVSADAINAGLGVRVTPLAIEIEHGKLLRARSIPSVRQFYNAIPIAMSLAPGELKQEVSGEP